MSTSHDGESSYKWRLRLNNLLQRSQYGSQGLAWSPPMQEGPPFNCYWSIIAYINDKQYGTGRSRTVGEAKEIATFGAFRELHREMYGSYPDYQFAN